MNFRVGQKVVFVWDQPWPTHYRLTFIETGSVHTIREIFEWGGYVGLRLVGVANRMGDGIELGYNALYFRPAVEPDISCFTQALKKKQHENQILARIPRKEKAHV